jgi:hypothetical protein
VTHRVLSKDEGIINPGTGQTSKPTTPRGQIVDRNGRTNFARAVAGAIAETRRQWRDFQRELVSKYGAERAQSMICALVTDDPLHECYAYTCMADEPARVSNCAFTVSTATAGTHTVKVSDGTYSRSATFSRSTRPSD